MGERRTRKSSEIKERETGRETKSRQQKKGHKEMEKRESKKEEERKRAGRGQEKIGKATKNKECESSDKKFYKGKRKRVKIFLLDFYIKIVDKSDVLEYTVFISF